MNYRVLLTPEAEGQLREAYNWWQENRAASPAIVIDEFEGVVSVLQELPGIGTRFRRATFLASGGSCSDHRITGCISSLTTDTPSFTF